MARRDVFKRYQGAARCTHAHLTYPVGVRCGCGCGWAAQKHTNFFCMLDGVVVHQRPLTCSYWCSDCGEGGGGVDSPRRELNDSRV